MSGHSKWATIKRKKGAADAKRGKLFTRLIKEITVAARMGGGDADGNPRLRSAVAGAKAASMPRDNIERAIKKGTGELEGESYEEITYEGFGPGGVAVLVETVTDNRNRTVGEVRSVLTKAGGNMGSTNSVSWKFDRKGVIPIPAEGITEDQLMGELLELGVDDYKLEDDTYVVYTEPAGFEDIRSALEKKNYTMIEPGIQMIPKETVPVEGKHVESVLRMLEKLEDLDDVQNVYANHEISAEDLEKYDA
jgi:YebC/PmpR family DNA-binding regulatory protein